MSGEPLEHSRGDTSEGTLGSVEETWKKREGDRERVENTPN